jgi:hypothetical protein
MEIKTKNLVVLNIKGGFGNQLFQYATALCIAIKNNAQLKIILDKQFSLVKFKDEFRLDYLNVNYELAIEDEYKSMMNSNDKINLFYKILRKLKFTSKYNKKSHINDSDGHKPESKIINAQSPCYIDGWCVKEIYFSEIRNKLINIFSYKYELSDNSKLLLNKITNSNSVSIHLRRGDYLNASNFFNQLDFNYYIKAIEILNSTSKNNIFYVFSDDIEWVKLNFKMNVEFNFVELNVDDKIKLDMEEFFLMKSCRHQIIANSSFSWWAAYLNDNKEKKVVYPKKWYSNKKWQKSYESHPFSPKEWVCL